MEKEDRYVLPDSFILPHYALIATLMVLLDKSELNQTVKKHCKTGLRVVGIIHADKSYNTGTNLLLNKEFDGFFALFPTEFFNNRALIPAIMIIENIEQCIKNNYLECVDS
ncbi:hypothetical protein Q4Q34_06395 [Flavivirga abyssicola]|uniref:hypothetical protein n=1 Tax=Flavivirga abyssicola TaxID=3063533 RepID=UPI0026DF363F|nr:hypothetical protein [Flavivirga sp. MEBiC07777]WVK14657.1 hypothetical protein Q4Q34_06395 [Flavivirga sp. MEBiC07777]